MQQTGGVFQAGPSSNFLIQGGQFVQNGPAPPVHNCYDADDGFKHLQAHVAPTAYASQQVGDAPKCHPNTRTAVLNAIMDWVVVAAVGLQWILWLNGAAGAGKSAIARSIVDLCLKQQIVIARFFFFRADPTRNNTKPVVATLAYQLIKSIPSLDSLITLIIRSDPLIFNESIETQFEALIFEPLRRLHKESRFMKPIVFLLDGVDECHGDDSQVNLIRTITQFVAKRIVPLIVIFSSRAESQLQMAFNSPTVDSILRRLPLDTDYRAANDIRLFLDDSFSEIKSTHRFRSSIDHDWPAPSLIQEIVDKSSSQFIYASVVIKFISSPRFHPVQQLEIVRGLRPAGELTPFAQLDALYRHIFSQVHDHRAISILAVVILSDFPYIKHICEMLDITSNDIHVALADLTSVISYIGARDGTAITFLHASLPDFLLDESRAQQFYIDKGLWHAQFALIFLRKRLSSGPKNLIPHHLSQARCNPQLREAVYTFSPANYISWKPALWSFYINTIKKMDFDDGGRVYRHQLDVVVRHMDKYYPTEMHYLDEKHDITAILGKIASEKEAILRDIVNSGRKVSFWMRSRSCLARVFKKQ
ncbi:hypothetical protein HYPSUDRAFT_46998 [Hypholoma sublateritium FD-334 SS-4]|uniref:NACHT domain-containing protein n=1 Tax=Hypholoma sublateritium (strain FD-334 SS-4) TaxID=945553 RepID=A0A0D2P918_HYPSF|nr:hypothetical protein HYPSUDRAFT_46998 [Hypholoma sublateritium FD-334 SS-4]